MKNKIHKIFKDYKKGYFPEEKHCDICAFTIPVLELLEQDIMKTLDNANVENDGGKNNG